jgi:hypothetical protein
VLAGGVDVALLSLHANPDGGVVAKAFLLSPAGPESHRRETLILRGWGFGGTSKCARPVADASTLASEGGDTAVGRVQSRARSGPMIRRQKRVSTGRCSLPTGVEVEDAMWEIYATGITHKPSFINAIFEEAYALAQAGTQH